MDSVLERVAGRKVVKWIHLRDERFADWQPFGFDWRNVVPDKNVRGESNLKESIILKYQMFGMPKKVRG